MAEDVDFIIDDILAPKGKQKVKSGAKGKRKERAVVKVLNDRFATLLSENPTWGAFSRSIGSGNRWGQNVQLSKTASDTFAGDLSVPTNFEFVIESKGGYNDVDLNSAFDSGHRQIDEFINQVSADAGRCGRKPMIVWSKDRKPSVVMLLAGVVPAEIEQTWQYIMKYREWRMYFLDDVLTLPNTFFFSLPNQA